MEKYTWADFTQEDYYEELLDFFSSLMPQEGIKAPAQSPIVFVSRKAYCLFLLLKKKGVIDDNGYEIYSDRYVMKNLDSELFRGKIVQVIDDTISTGFHMSEIVEMIVSKTSATFEEIRPKVFMEDENYSEKRKNIKFYQKHNLRVESVCKKDSNSILRFCSKETLLMHQENIPYMIEVPNICDARKQEYYIELTEEEFDRLKAENKLWKYYCGEQVGYAQCDVRNDIIIREKHIIAELFSDFIFNFSVRVQVNQVDGKYQLVMLPFAILKSVRFDELLSFFYLIYGNTPYGREIKENENRTADTFAQDNYIAIYRGVVFFLSMYFADEFVKYLPKVIGGDHEFSLYRENYKYNFDQNFIITEKLMDTNSYLGFTSTMLQFGFFSKVRVQNKEKLVQYSNIFDGVCFNYQNTSLFLLAVINKMRNDPAISGNQKNEVLYKFLSIEEYEELMRWVFPAVAAKERNDMLALCFVNMLSQSKISNEIYFDINTGVVYRGFRYGENSEAYFEISAKVFYAAVEQYYHMVHYKIESECSNLSKKEEKEKIYELYKNRYVNMLLHLKKFLSGYGLLGEVMTSDEFFMYSQIFSEGNIDTLSNNIENKKFLLDDKKTPYYIERLRAFIRESNVLD